MLSATTLAKKIRQKEITSSEIVKAYITRIKEVNPFINAVIGDRFLAALTEAKNCDDQLKAGKFDIETLEKEKPLYGVPISIKECLAVKGCSYGSCSLPRKEIKADRDATIVKILRNAGAIPLCVTNTPEMSSGYETANLSYGRTCNPYNTKYSVGGSSGGEGALLGAGASVIGLGSDLAGSIRIPAFFNGIFGLKPTPGLMPLDGHLPHSEDKYLHYLLTFGPMTRYAEDLSLLLRVMTLKCNRDLRLNVPVDLKQIKVYYRQGLDNSFGVLSMPEDIKDCILRAAHHFSHQYGIRAEKLPIEWPVTINEIVLTGFLNIKEVPRILDDPNDPKHKNPTVEFIKGLFGLSQYTKQASFFTSIFESHFPFRESEISLYKKQGEEIRQKLIDLLGDNGVLIYPTYRKPVLSRVAIFEMMAISNSGLFNMIGLPAVNIPMGLNRDGLPIGIQVIAAPYQDRLCLAVAKELETAFGGWIPPSTSLSN